MDKKNLLAVVGVLVGILSFSFNVWNTARLNLRVAVTSSVSLLQANQNDIEELRISYGDKQIKGLSRIRVVISNQGNSALTPEDFVTPLTLSFGPQSPLLSARVDDRKPTSLAGKLEVDSAAGTVRLLPELLNPGDQLVISLYVASEKVELPTVTGRVKGIPEITLADRRRAEEAGGDPAFLKIAKGVAWFCGLLVGLIGTLMGLVDTVRTIALNRAMPVILERVRVAADSEALLAVLNSSKNFRALNSSLYKEFLERASRQEQIGEAREFITGKLPAGVRSAQVGAFLGGLLFLILGLWSTQGLLAVFQP